MSQKPKLDDALTTLGRNSAPKDLRVLYEQGATMLQLAEATGLARNTVRRRLRSAQTPMRSRGRPVRALPDSAGRVRARSSSVVLRHVLARRLLQLRAQAHLSQAQAAHAIGVKPLTVLRAEKPFEPLSLAVLHGLCTLYDAPPHVREELILLRHEGRVPAWWTQQNLHVPEGEYSSWGLRADASRIRGWAEHIVPQFVQTPDYARAIAPRGAEAGSAEMAVAVLLAAQQRTRRRGIDHGYVVDEAVIRRCVGGPRVMATQLTVLRSLAVQGHLRVLSWYSGHPHPGDSFELCWVPGLDTVLYHPSTRTLHHVTPARAEGAVCDHQNEFAHLWEGAEHTDATVLLIDQARASLLASPWPRRSE